MFAPWIIYIIYITMSKIYSKFIGKSEVFIYFIVKVLTKIQSIKSVDEYGLVPEFTNADTGISSE